MARTGEVGEATYEAVTALEGNGMTRQEAFNKVADERGAQAGTVAANYYRVARQHKNGKKSAPKRSAPVAHTPQRTNSDAQALYLCIEKMVDAAVDRRLQRLLS